MPTKRLEKLNIEIREALRARDFSQAEKLAERLVKAIESAGINGSFVATAYSEWAKLVRRRKDYPREVEILKRYLDQLGREPSLYYECDILDRLNEAREKHRRYVPDRSTCDMCEKQNRLLTRIDSGHSVCSVCLREFPSKGKSEKLSTYHRNQFKSLGLTVPENPTPEEIIQLKEIAMRRHLGLSDDATVDEIEECIRPKPKEFNTKVAGVSHENSDGSVRQKIIERCSIGERLRLIREPTNSYNGRAVKVCRMNGEQLGYLGDHIVGNDQGIGWCVANDLDAGSESQVVICNITGEYGRRGVNIHVMLGVPPR